MLLKSFTHKELLLDQCLHVTIFVSAYNVIFIFVLPIFKAKPLGNHGIWHCKLIYQPFLTQLRFFAMNLMLDKFSMVNVS